MSGVGRCKRVLARQAQAHRVVVPEAEAAHPHVPEPRFARRSSRAAPLRRGRARRMAPPTVLPESGWTSGWPGRRSTRLRPPRAALPVPRWKMSLAAPAPDVIRLLGDESTKSRASSSVVEPSASPFTSSFVTTPACAYSASTASASSPRLRDLGARVLGQRLHALGPAAIYRRAARIAAKRPERLLVGRPVGRGRRAGHDRRRRSAVTSVGQLDAVRRIVPFAPPRRRPQARRHMTSRRSPRSRGSSVWKPCAAPFRT